MARRRVTVDLPSQGGRAAPVAPLSNDVIVEKPVEGHTHDDDATLSKVEVLGFIETVVTLRQHAKKLYKSVWFSQRVLHYPLTCKCSSSITKIIDKALTFFFSKLAWPACLGLLTALLCAKVFPTLLEYLPTY